MLSSTFDVGNSQFRTTTKSGYVDTVPFGSFKKEVFDKYGYYDERLTRNQDNEMNYRIRKHGGQIYMSNEIQLIYYCRNTIRDIANMAIQNGKWNIVTMYLCPGSMGWRHFIPFLFVLSLLILIPLCMISYIFQLFLCLELLLYVSLDIYFSFKICSGIKSFLLLSYLFPVFHISYGYGSCIGICKIFKLKRERV